MTTHNARAMGMAVAVFVGLMGFGEVMGADVKPMGADTPSGTTIMLVPGQIQSAIVSDVQRVAVGNPDVADVTIVSPQEVLIQAKEVGMTNLLIWEATGRRAFTVRVLDPEAEFIAQELPQLLSKTGFSDDVRVEFKSGQVFLLGEVDTQAQLDYLEQVTSSFKGVVTNLVSVREGVVTGTNAPLVRLAVQLIEISSSDLYALGVDWNDTVAFTEKTQDYASIADTIRIGQSVQRSNFSATLGALVEENKARLLSEPKLVTTSGKEAESFMGVEVPVLEATSVGSGTGVVSANIGYRKTGVLLTMTPNVHSGTTPMNDRRITTTLNAEVSSIDPTVGLTVPVGDSSVLVVGFRVRRANTEVTTASGQTIVIAGLLQVEDQVTEERVPGVSKVPLLGRLFRAPVEEGEDRELVIAVTPELVMDEEREAAYSDAVKRAASVVQLTTGVADARLRYALQVQDRIAKAIRYPSKYKAAGLDQDRTVMLRLHLSADGTLNKAALSQPSGIDALDAEAIKTAETQAPYPAFPEGVPEQELWLDVPIVYRR